MLKKLLAAAMIWAAMAVPQAYAFEADEALPDPAQEARAIEISRSLRCLVCQNQSIEDSNAELARDLRALVRERIAKGDTDDQVREFVVDRYGDWVLLKPPFKGYTYALWFGPFVLLILAVVGAVTYFRRGSHPVTAPLTADEAARLRDLLQQAGEK